MLDDGAASHALTRPWATRPARRRAPRSSAEAPSTPLRRTCRAIDEGADALECDVRLSSDGELVCLHDRTLERTGGSTGIVGAMSLAELRAVDWGAWKHGTDAGRDPESGALVTLRDLVEMAIGAGRELGLAVETKHPSRAGGRVEHEVATLLREYGIDGARRPGQVWVRMMSFSAMAVRRMAGLCPDLPLVLLVSAQQPLPLRRSRARGGRGHRRTGPRAGPRTP